MITIVAGVVCSILQRTTIQHSFMSPRTSEQTLGQALRSMPIVIASVGNDRVVFRDHLTKFLLLAFIHWRKVLVRDGKQILTTEEKRALERKVPSTFSSEHTKHGDTTSLNRGVGQLMV